MISLRELLLFKTNVEGSLEALRKMTSLTKLELGNTNVEGSLAFLRACVSLVRVSLPNNPGLTSGLSEVLDLQALPNLIALDVSYNNMADIQLDAFIFWRSPRVFLLEASGNSLSIYPICPFSRISLQTL